MVNFCILIQTTELLSAYWHVVLYEWYRTGWQAPSSQKSPQVNLQQNIAGGLYWPRQRLSEECPGAISCML